MERIPAFYGRSYSAYINYVKLSPDYRGYGISNQLVTDAILILKTFRPAPYLASRGMKWLQVYEDRGMSDATLKEHFRASYDLVAAGISKKKRAELGIVPQG